MSTELISQGEIIVLVEDSPEVTLLITHYLNNIGHKTKCYESGETFLPELDYTVALVLLGIGLPGIDGTEILPEIIKTSPDTAVVMLTGTTDLEVALTCIRNGATDYLTKPVSIKQLEKTVSQALEKRSQKIKTAKYQIFLEQRLRELSNENNNSIIRSIEFAPEHLQAGLGILNYFSKILQDKYPDKSPKIKIEQEGLKVRMVIEPEEGDNEIIEKTLELYESVIRGEISPKELLNSDLQILDLRNELRIAQMRIESTKELIQHKENEINNLKDLFQNLLSRPPANSTPITLSPTIYVSNKNENTVSPVIDMIELSNQLEELANKSKDKTLKTKLLELQTQAEDIKTNKDLHNIQESGFLRKLKEFMDEAQKVGTSANKLINTTSDGLKNLQKMGKKYNSIAEWCGAPQIPKILLNNDKK